MYSIHDLEVVALRPPPGVLSELSAGMHRTPIVFRNALDIPVCSPQQAFSAWLHAANEQKSGRTSGTMRLYARGVPVTEMSSFWPQLTDGDFAGYFARLEKYNEIKEYAGCLSDVQSASAVLYRRLLGFLGELFELTGVPCGKASANLFVINHGAHLFPVHKDQQDVFTFVLEGTRKYYLWHFDVLQRLANVASDKRLDSVMLYDLDYREYIQDALVFEVQPGDLLYWPCEWWHIGVGCDAIATTIAVGISRTYHIARFLLYAANSMHKRGTRWEGSLTGSPGNRPSSSVAFCSESISRLLSDDLFKECLDEELLAWRTACGFEHLPAPLTDAPILGDTEEFVLSGRSAIEWKLKDGMIRCHIAGRCLSLPQSRERIMALNIATMPNGRLSIESLLDSILNVDPTVDITQIRDVLRELLNKIELYHGLQRVRHL